MVPHADVTLPWSGTPIEVLSRWPDRRRVHMLHSGRLHPRWARWTLVAESDGALTFVNPPDGPPASQWHGPDDATASTPWRCRPFTDLRQVCSDGSLWIGYLAYDLARHIERLPTHAAADRRWPLIQLERCPGWAVHDGLTGEWHPGGAWADQGPPALLPVPADPRFTAGRARSNRTRAEHEAAVARAIEYIAAGDIFQVNLAQRFTAELSGSTRGLFASLMVQSPAWYAAYLELQPTDATAARTILSSSPELFLQLDADGTVITRPIKGTRPAHIDPEVLRRSAKDTAELNMIVDLLRNDLGRVCTYGSIQVAEPRTIESHPTVHHGVATIRGRLHESKDLTDLLRATMPGGSITGAPKVRAMQIIEELEPVRRGPAFGAIGFIHGRTACFNLAIRSMFAEIGPNNRGTLDFTVGGGIVADSDPAGEYDESLDKAAAIMGALRPHGSDRRRPNRPATSIAT